MGETVGEQLGGQVVGGRVKGGQVGTCGGTGGWDRWVDRGTGGETGGTVAWYRLGDSSVLPESHENSLRRMFWAATHVRTGWWMVECGRGCQLPSHNTVGRMHGELYDIDCNACKPMPHD